MAFKLKSGNKTNFKSMGSSPVKDKPVLTHDHDYGKEHGEKSPAKATTERTPEQQKRIKDSEAASARHKKYMKTEGENFTKNEKGVYIHNETGKTVKEMNPSPAKQRLTKGGEGQDQDKILDAKGNHIGNWVGDKKVMLTQEQIEDAKGVTTNINMPKVHVDPPKHKTHGAGDTGNWEPHQFRTKKKKSPAKQTDTTYADGSKKSQREQDFSKRHTAEKAKDKYWYKIDGKKATKEQYLKYENKPGNMEGGGKQTKNPDVYGRITSNHGRGPKTK